MIVAAGPYAIVIGFAVSAALLWIAVGDRIGRFFRSIGPGVAEHSVTEDLKTRLGAVRENFQTARRVKKFMPQLESALRMISSSLRVGLSFRQSLVIVAEELDEPAKAEFSRVIGRTNLGLSLLDALDELSVRLPSPELTMVVRAIRVQSGTGGDLADLLDGVGDTIKARRTLARKVAALTAEGRMSAYVILALPVGVGIFLGISQPHMGHALLFTTIGHISLAIVLVLETLASIIIAQMLKVQL